MLFMLFIRTSVLLTVTAQKNLSPYGKATQSSQYHLGAPKNAINPPESNEWGWNKCTHTSPYRSPSWWMFTFSFGYAFITDIEIYYRENFAYRMDGFKLYVSNTSIITATTSYLCYQDPDPGEPNITQTISCNQIGQYVIYYDDKIGKGDRGSIIELCYVAINGCQKGFWGNDCAKPCAANCIERHCYLGNGACVWGCNSGNCLNDQCDRQTSVCTNGCKKRRTGEYCDKYNVASDGSVLQSSSGSENAMLVNDGNITSCSKTWGEDIWYQVDIKEKGFVTGMYFTFGVNTSTVGLHTIYASDTSNAWRTGTVLYQQESIPRSIYSICRYLTYVPPTQFSHFELCEIGIIGCPPAQYGPLCTHMCPITCRGPCDLETGYCSLGCLDGWMGEKCEQECTDMFYGKDCLQQCSTNCFDPKCNHLTGMCIGGCKDGWQGTNCTQECRTGHFGRNCSKLCSGCVSNMCEPFDGLCSNTTACNAGYKYGKYCNEECSTGQFGRNCSKFCTGCVSNMCEPFDGLCSITDACEPGYKYGKYCNEECSTGQFGRNCSKSCTGCISNLCEPFDGLCSNTTACKPGYQYGKYCNKECDNGNFGENCKEFCYGCISHICDSVNGLCYNSTGCESGYLYDEYCNNRCENRNFGDNCTRTCYCLTTPCNTISGKCPPGGCKKGWHGESCESRKISPMICSDCNSWDISIHSK